MENLHNWNVSYSQARELQLQLASKVKITPIRKNITLIAGLDCAISIDGKKIIAAVVVLKSVNTGDYSDQMLSRFEIVETKSASLKLTMPYIPGLLSFREAPVCISAVKKLATKPDVFMVDGQGIAHPRRLGLAAHLGLFLDKPTIGCAKKRLIGSYAEPAPEKGNYSLLKDQGQVIGAVVRTRTNVKPVFVSVGNKSTLEDAIRITLACAVKYRLPEPTHLAHQTVTKLKSIYQ